MIRPLSIALLLGLAAWGCRGTAPATVPVTEPPAPLIEPETGPAAGLVDLRADEVVRRMSDHLARAMALALEAEEIYDEVPEHSPR